MLRLFVGGLALFFLGGCALSSRTPPPEPVRWSALESKEPAKTPDLAKSPLKLADVLSAALARNPTLRMAEAEWHAARIRPRHVTALPNPALTLSGMVEHIQTRNGPVEFTIMLHQMIPFPGKLSSRGEVAEHEALLMWEKYMTSGLDLVAETTKAYYELYWVQRAERITAENRTLLQRLIRVAQTKYAADEVSQQDVLKAQVEHAKVSEEWNRLQDLERVARARINRALNRPYDAALGNPPDFKVSEVPIDLAKLIALAEDSRPEIRLAKRAVRRWEAAESLAGKEFFPDFAAGFQYSFVGDTDLMGAADPGRDAWGFTVGLTLPLWWGRNQAILDESRARLRAARASLEMMRNDSRFLLTRHHSLVQIAMRRVKLYRDNIVPQARQALEISEQAYAAQAPAKKKVDFESVIDNQRRLLDFRLTQARAEADFEQHRADLERVFGRSLLEVQR